MTKKNLARVAAILATGMLAAGATTAVAQSPPRRPLIRLEKNGVMSNKSAGYYFTVPPGWVLDNSSKYENVKIVHKDSGAVFGVSYWQSPGTPGMNYEALRMSLESSEMHWLRLGKGSVTVGGRDAWGFRGTREKEGIKVKEFIWLAQVGESVYMLSATVDMDKFEARAAEIDEMFSTFSWGNPPAMP